MIAAHLLNSLTTRSSNAAAQSTGLAPPSAVEACHSALHGCMLLEIASGSLSTCIASCILALLVLDVPEQGPERIAIINIKKDNLQIE